MVGTEFSELLISFRIFLYLKSHKIIRSMFYFYKQLKKKVLLFKSNLSFPLDQVPKLSNRLIIEIVPYKQNHIEWSPKLIQDNANLFAKDKEKESYEYKMYQTNLLNLVIYESTLNQIENRISIIEQFLNKVMFF